MESIKREVSSRKNTVNLNLKFEPNGQYNLH